MVKVTRVQENEKPPIHGLLTFHAKREVVGFMFHFTPPNEFFEKSWDFNNLWTTTAYSANGRRVVPYTSFLIRIILIDIHCLVCSSVFRNNKQSAFLPFAALA